ncbi:Quinone oxidoreductase PIG3, partial [Geodia barretti]
LHPLLYVFPDSSSRTLRTGPSLPCRHRRCNDDQRAARSCRRLSLPAFNHSSPRAPGGRAVGQGNNKMARASGHSLVHGTFVREASSSCSLLQVKAAGVNRLDLLQAAGRYPPPPGDSQILGVEVSGVVEEISDAVAGLTGSKKGDPVMALVGGGGYAEYAAVPYQTVTKIPSGVTFPQAAGIMEVFLTAYQALTWNGHLKDNETILIHAGASGVGLGSSAAV